LKERPEPGGHLSVTLDREHLVAFGILESKGAEENHP
jgi:hypothetical protein